MAQTAIIDTTTRVIKRLTTVNPPSYDTSTETPVSLPSSITLDKFYILNQDLSLTPATTTQVQQAGLDDDFIRQQRLMNIQNLKIAIQTLQADATVPNTVKQTFIAFVKAFLS